MVTKIGLPHFDSQGNVLDKQGKELATRQELDDVENSLQDTIDDLVLASGGGYAYSVPDPSSTWNIPNNLGRVPNVSFYLDSIGPILQEYDVVPGFINVTWPYPVSGYAVVT